MNPVFPGHVKHEVCMQKKQIRMRFPITALIMMLAGILIGACDSPTSPKSNVTPAEQQPDDVTYFGNGNTAGKEPLDTNIYRDKDSNRRVPVMGRNNLYRVGYRFAGWTAKADGSGTVYTENGAIPDPIKKYPLKLYAKWEEVFPRISAGENFSTLVTKDGEVYTAGSDGNGRLGNGSTADNPAFTRITLPNNQKAQRVISGWDHSFALLSDGNVAGWGSGDYGKLGMGNDQSVTAPKLPNFTVTGRLDAQWKIVHIAAGLYQTALIDNKGDYWAAGTRHHGALGNGVRNPDKETQFKQVASGVASTVSGRNYSGVASAASGRDYILLVKNDGFLWVSGRGANGRLGLGNKVATDIPELKKLTAMGNDNAAVFAGKNNHSMVLKEDGRLFSAGNNNAGQLGQGDTAEKYVFAPVIDNEGKPMTDVAFVSLGENHSMILKKDGSLWAAGRNGEYQLGLGSPLDQYKAVKVMNDVAHVAAGNNFTLAIKEDGTLWAAGSNANGQFGQGAAGGTNKTWTRIDFKTGTNPPANNPPQP
jgi:uncharacterized repeat protein (TIGR02543 family)